MLIIGLTGSIAMGKSETAKMFARHGVPVCDSDSVVHELYGPGGAAVGPIAKAFPRAVRDGAVDRAALSRLIEGDPSALQRLEAIVHPLVRKAQDTWLAEQARAGAPVVVLDIPLLFESGGEDRVDVIVVVSAPEETQRTRALARRGMTAEKLELIRRRQMPHAEKCARADFIVDTSVSLEDAERQVVDILAALKQREGKAWTP